MKAEEAVDRFQAGELSRRVWDELVVRARFLVDDLDEAEDLAQEAIVVLLERTSAGGDDLEDPRAFLLGCIRMLARNKHQQRRRRSQILAAVHHPQAVPDHANSVEIRYLCYQLLAELPPTYARILRMRYLDGMPAQVIAERLGTTPGAVRQRLHRARKEARKMVIHLDPGRP